MSNAAHINCDGLSTVLAVLRIKQRLLTINGGIPLIVSVSGKCDKQTLVQSLGVKANNVQFV